jgi:transposase
MSHTTIITGPERRRRWRLDEKLAILQEAFAPGAVVSEVARRRELSTALIYNWRRQALAEPAGILPARIVGGDPSTPAGAGAGASADSCVRVALASGAKVEVPFGAPPEMVSALLRALR